MAKRILIVDDEEVVSKALAEVCLRLGHEARTARTGQEALDKFAAQTADLLLLDLLLPGNLDGARLAEQMRTKPGGAEMQIIVISGFLKDQRMRTDLQSKAGVRHFLPKPLLPADLEALINQLLGAPPSAAATGPSLPGVPVGQAAAPLSESARTGMDSFEASLTERPALQLFVELNRVKAEGVLDLTRGQVKKRFYLQRGHFRYATSNVKAETLSGLLPAQRGIPEARVNDALAHAKAEGIALTDALVELGLVAAKDLPGLLTLQTEEVAITCHAWSDGQASFKANPVTTGPEGRANPVHCALKAAKRFGQAAEARARLQALGPAVLDRTPELEREQFTIRGLWQGDTTLPAVNGKTPLPDILSKSKDVDVLMLDALITTGLARARGGTPPKTAAGPPSLERGVAAPRRPNRPYTPEEVASREAIRQEWARLERSQTHYEVLGVPKDAPAADLKSAYLRLARSFHTDVFTGQELGDMAPLQKLIFEKASEANAAVGDATKRADYDDFLSRKARGLPTDVEQILKAENAHQRGDALKKAGRLRDAEKLFREAVTINPGESTFLFALADAAWTLQGKVAAAEVLSLLDKGLALRQDLDALRLKAEALLESGEPQAALDTIRIVTGNNPGFPKAMDILRKAKDAVATGKATTAATLKGGGDAAKGGGLLGKLFGGKGK